eukprot:15466991-Alexandrium_andersonii.AAC.1
MAWPSPGPKEAFWKATPSSPEAGTRAASAKSLSMAKTHVKLCWTAPAPHLWVPLVGAGSWPPAIFKRAAKASRGS